MYTALCLYRDQFAHIKPVEIACEGKINFIYDDTWNENLIEELKPDIVIGINEFHWEIAKCYKRAKQLNIPTLTLQDGILEWRFMFQNELYDGDAHGSPLHHPIIADKYACIGFSMANIIAGLGNPNQVEIIGMPKLDKIPTIDLKPKPNHLNAKRVLIITAAKPWFTDSQKAIVVKMLSDLKVFFEENKDFEPVWRITKLLDKEVKVETSFVKKESAEIVTQILNTDLIISTTSTAILEAMRCGKPVAKIDYFSIPDFLPTVWNIHQKRDIDIVLKKMMQPTPQECWYQNYLLHSHCVNDNFASIRATNLILDMIHFNIKSKNEPLPASMVGDWNLKSEFDYPTLANFYPKRNVFRMNEISELQAEIVRLELKNQIQKKALDKRSFGIMLLTAYSKIKKKITSY